MIRKPSRAHLLILFSPFNDDDFFYLRSVHVDEFPGVRTVDVGSWRSNDGTDAQQEMERIDGSFGRTSRNVSRWNRKQGRDSDEG